jgi:hypothetical protein
VRPSIAEEQCPALVVSTNGRMAAPIRVFTVEYIDKKSVHTAGQTTLRMCTLFRPPKNAVCAYPRDSFGKLGCRLRMGLMPIARR